jgi:hypothetical protein
MLRAVTQSTVYIHIHFISILKNGVPHIIVKFSSAVAEALAGGPVYNVKFLLVLAE